MVCKRIGHGQAAPDKAVLQILGKKQTAAGLLDIQSGCLHPGQTMHNISHMWVKNRIPHSSVSPLNHGGIQLVTDIEDTDPHPLKWSTLRYVFGQKEDRQCRESAISPKRSSRS